MKTYGVVQLYLQLFLFMALSGVSGWSHAPAVWRRETALSIHVSVPNWYGPFAEEKFLAWAGNANTIAFISSP